MDCELLEEGVSTTSLGNTGPTGLIVKNVFLTPYVQSKPTSFSLKLLSPVLSLQNQVKSISPSFL